MPDDGRVPVLVGVGQVRGNTARAPEAAREPLALAEDAARAAGADSGAPALLSEADSVLAIKSSSWAYDDLPTLLARRLHASPKHRATTTVGGHWPAALLDEAAAGIASGDSRVALLVGAEAQASVSALARAGLDPGADHGWTREPGGPPSFEPDELGSTAMQSAGLVMPTRVYPLFENRLRYRTGQSPAANTAASARMYAAFTEVAARNPAAWNPTVRSAEDIATVGPANRMVCEPYPLAMNAMPHVDQAAAVLVTSLATAREYGISEDRIVYVRGGAGAHDSGDILDRPDFSRSAALETALRRCLTQGGVSARELDVLDVYSCFPVVPKLVVEALGLPADSVPTVTGGHSAFGGPLSSYSLHATVAVATRLRAGAATGLVHANGGYLTAQHAVLLSRAPHPDGYVGDPDPVSTSSADSAPPKGPVPDGEVVVETATVEYGKDGAPSQGFLIGRTGDGTRVVGQTAPGDAASAQALSVASGTEVVGRTVRVSAGEAFLEVAPAG
ncbi:hypothetical protein [Saccharomonospora iraqiensis]|uniref:hypothetical protein n=1 Tax=Saccharomonospora iraqiensis TaxID=52698 RepID=UPI00041BD200|nr:hypothetical protein [Saccharomonospora iraqiensis]